MFIFPVCQGKKTDNGRLRACPNKVSEQQARTSHFWTVYSVIELFIHVWSCNALISITAVCADRRQEEPFKMWDRRKMLLAAIVFTALFYNVSIHSLIK